jgi:hypothetical protein
VIALKLRRSNAMLVTPSTAEREPPVLSTRIGQP